MFSYCIAHQHYELKFLRIMTSNSEIVSWFLPLCLLHNAKFKTKNESDVQNEYYYSLIFDTIYSFKVPQYHYAACSKRITSGYSQKNSGYFLRNFNKLNET